MTGEEALNEIKARKDALAKQAQSNLNANYNIYSDYLSKTAQNENKGALNSYQNYPAGTDSTRARSAYLNRLASANDAYAEGTRGLNLYRNKLGANMDAASLNADATINGLEYKNALYDAQMQYQRERDAVADAQWQKNFDLGYLSSTGTSGRGGSYYGGGYVVDSPTDPTDEGTTKRSIIDAINERKAQQVAYDYALSLYGRGANAGQNTAEVETAMYQIQQKANNPVYDQKVENAYTINTQRKASNASAKKSTVTKPNQNKKVDMTK